MKMSFAVLLYNHDWTLCNVSFMRQNKELVDLNEFKMGLNGEFSLKATLSISGYKILNIVLETSYFSSRKESNVKALFYLHFLDSKREVIPRLSILVEPFEDKWEKDINASSFITEDSLTVRFSVSLENIDTSTHVTKAEIPETLHVFCQDMQRIVSDRKSSADIKIIVGGQEFLAHKIILSCHSSYFAKILKEKSETEVVDLQVIELDGDSDLFQCALTYVYTGKIVFPNFKSVFDLFQFVQKYEFNDLVAVFQPEESVTHSKVEFELLTYEWNIPYFLTLESESLSPIYSPVFESPSEYSVKWKLLLRRKDDKYIHVSLEYLNERSVPTTFQISVLKSDLSNHEDRYFTHIYEKGRNIWPSETDPNGLFRLDSTISVDTFLRIRCIIRISKEELRREFQYKSSSGRGNLDLTVWSSNFGKLLEDKKFCDTCLQVGADLFSVHKLILSARSSVFRKMFEVNMSESLNGIVKIDDIDSSMVNILLKYIYTGNTSDIKIEFASDIFHAADKYDMLCLKNKCSEFMKKNINLTNACELFLLGDLYGDSEMKSLAKDYICRNSRCLVCPAGQAMIKAHPDVVSEICDKISNAFCSVENSEMISPSK